MSHTNSEVNFTQLAWIKEQIDIAFEDAQTILVNALDDDDHEESIKGFKSFLRKVRGPIKLIGFKVALELIDEIILTADMLIDFKGNIDTKNNILENLMCATICLVNYFSLIQTDNTEKGMILIPQLATLRSVRNAKALNLGKYLPESFNLSLNDMHVSFNASIQQSFQTSAKNARIGFMVGVVDFIKDIEPELSLKKMKTALGMIKEQSYDERATTFWWLMECLVDSFHSSKDLYIRECKLLLGDIERVLKYTSEKGDSDITGAVSEDLIKSAIYIILSNAYSSPTFNELKEKNIFDDAIRSVCEIDILNRRIIGSESELFKTICEQANLELNSVKDSLDLYSRASNPNPDLLQTAWRCMRHVSGALQIIHQEQLGVMLTTQIDLLEKALRSGNELSDEELVSVAEVVINIESLISEALKRESFDDVANKNKYDVSLLHDVVNAALKDVSKIKSILMSFYDNDISKDELSQVSGGLVKLSNSLAMLDYYNLVKLLQRVDDLIISNLITSKKSLKQSCMDDSAEVVTLIEYYLQSIKDNGAAHEEIIVQADLILDRLSDRLESKHDDELETGKDVDDDITIFKEETEIHLTLIKDCLDVIHSNNKNDVVLENYKKIRSSIHTIKGNSKFLKAFAISKATEHLKNMLVAITTEQISAEPAHHTIMEETCDFIHTLVEDNNLLSDELHKFEPVIEKINSLSLNAKKDDEGNQTDHLKIEQLKQLIETCVYQYDYIESDPIDEDDEDSFIRGVYIEEAAENIALISENIKMVLYGDVDAISTIRRAFHTIKGSGKLVQATSIVDLALASETLLNKVIEGVVELNFAVVSNIIQSTALLPLLLNHFKGGDDYSSQIIPLIKETEKISENGYEGNGIVDINIPKVGASDSQIDNIMEDDAVEGQSESDESLHNRLVTIYIKEAEGHIETLSQWIDSNESQDNYYIDQSITIALHTLKGSSRSANILDISEIFSYYEELFNKLISRKMPVELEIVASLGQVISATKKLLKTLPEDSTLKGKDRLIRQVKLFIENYAANELSEMKASNEKMSINNAVNSKIVEKESGKQSEIDNNELSGDLGPPSDDVINSLSGQLTEQENAAIDIETANLAANINYIRPSIDYDLEMFREAFFEEYTERNDTLLQALDSLSKGDNDEILDGLLRDVHSLKGSANTINLTPIADISHHLETAYEHIVAGKQSVPNPLIDITYTYLDSVSLMIERANNELYIFFDDELSNALKQFNSESDDKYLVDFNRTLTINHSLPESYKAALQHVHTVIGTTVELESIKAEHSGELSELAVNMINQLNTGFNNDNNDRRKTDRKSQEQIRIRTEIMENLADVTGELSISRSHIEQKHRYHKFNMSEIDLVFDRINDKIKAFSIESESKMSVQMVGVDGRYNDEFDTLEMDRFSSVQTLSRSLQEAMHDLMSVKDMIEVSGRDMDTLLVQQNRLIDELQDNLVSARTIPFGQLINRLRSTIRVASKDIGKDVELNIIGAEESLDRNILDKIAAPLEHLLRNAIDHGIESTEDRIACNKSEKGNITLDITKEGQLAIIKVIDDGRGIDVSKVKKKAISQGLMRDDQQLTDAEITQFILNQGFSTAENITQVSGRGVGMDAVNQEIKLLSGSLDIQSIEGEGSTFTIKIPLVLAKNRALLLKINGNVYAVPLSVIDAVVLANQENVLNLHKHPEAKIEHESKTYEFHYLGQLLRTSNPVEGDDNKVPLVMMHVGDRNICIHVDELIGNKEIVAKPLSSQIANIPGLSGATIQGDGTVVLILDMHSLIRIYSLTGYQQKVIEQDHEEELNKPTVMIVDDSITVRKIASRFLEKNGYNVQLAKDGLDALNQLLEGDLPDVMLLDIEMPIMDGFELAQSVLNNPDMDDIPIIMITSRTGDKHKQRAYSLGVKSYLGKPYNEDELLNTIKKLLKEGSRAIVT